LGGKGCYAEGARRCLVGCALETLDKSCAHSAVIALDLPLVQPRATSTLTAVIANSITAVSGIPYYLYPKITQCNVSIIMSVVLQLTIGCLNPTRIYPTGTVYGILVPKAKIRKA
jgi:hypothetical protein